MSSSGSIQSNSGQQQLYQRAVTPTVQNLGIALQQQQQDVSHQQSTNSASAVKGKVLSYGANTHNPNNPNSSASASNSSKTFAQQQPLNISSAIRSPRNNSVGSAAIANNANTDMSALPNQLASLSVGTNPPTLNANMYLPPRYDMIPNIHQTVALTPTNKSDSSNVVTAQTDELGIPLDGIIFAKIRGN
jgi:hypothetical protein